LLISNENIPSGKQKDLLFANRSTSIFFALLLSSFAYAHKTIFTFFFHHNNSLMIDRSIKKRYYKEKLLNIALQLCSIADEIKQQDHTPESYLSKKILAWHPSKDTIQEIAALHALRYLWHLIIQEYFDLYLPAVIHSIIPYEKDFNYSAIKNTSQLFGYLWRQ